MSLQKFMSPGAPLPKDKRRSRQGDRVRLHVDDWDYMATEDADGKRVLLACFSNTAGNFELVLTPARVVQGINLATSALVKGGILPKAARTG